MSLHDVTVETAAHAHRAFEIHRTSGLQAPEIRAFEGLAYSGYSVCAVGICSCHCQAHAVVSHRLVHSKLLGEAAADGKLDIGFHLAHTHYACRLFYYS